MRQQLAVFFPAFARVDDGPNQNETNGTSLLLYFFVFILLLSLLLCFFYFLLTNLRNNQQASIFILVHSSITVSFFFSFAFAHISLFFLLSGLGSVHRRCLADALLMTLRAILAAPEDHPLHNVQPGLCFFAFFSQGFCFALFCIFHVSSFVIFAVAFCSPW